MAAPAIKTETPELREISRLVTSEASGSRPQTPPVLGFTESAAPSIAKSAVARHVEELAVDLVHAANKGNFEITSFPWTPHCSASFSMTADLFLVHDRGLELTSLKGLLDWHQQMQAEKTAEWRLEYRDAEASVDESAGKAVVFANFVLVLVGPVRIPHTNVMEFARYGAKEDGVWKLLRMSSLRGQSMNDGR